MRKLVIAAILVTALMAGVGLAYIFKTFNRYGNPDAPKPKLVIYTHSSFMDVYGPGPELARDFEAACRCQVEWVDAGSGQMILQKLQLAATKHVDLVLGFDKLILKSATASVRWKQVKVPDAKFLEVFQKNRFKNFVPYNWSPLTFIAAKEFNEKVSFFDFLQKLPEASISVPRPAVSTPGLQLAMYIFDLSGRSLENYRQNLEKLAPKFGFQGADWSASYGAFQKGQFDFTWSFLTSLLYHWKNPGKDQKAYAAVQFTEGHPVHLDYAAIPEQCMSCGIAQSFVEYLLSSKGQKILLETNYMWPVLQMNFEKPSGMLELQILNYENLDELVDQKQQIIHIWDQVNQ